jgi:hypothetical protein
MSRLAWWAISWATTVSISSGVKLWFWPPWLAILIEPSRLAMRPVVGLHAPVLQVHEILQRPIKRHHGYTHSPKPMAQPLPASVR